MCRLRSETLHKCLLAEHDLIFDGAVATAPSMEAAGDTHTLRGGDLAQQGAIYQIPQQHPFQKTPGNSSHARECYRCGSSAHVATNSCFQDTICHYSQKRGYIVKVCRSRAPPTGRQMATGNQGRGRQTAKWIQVTQGDDDNKSDPDLPVCIVGGQAS